MKFLIDECPSPTLVEVARKRGHPYSTHVTWIGLAAATDWTLSHHAVDEGFVFVTSNRLDFLKLYTREELHGGLVCLNSTHATLNRDQQQRLFAEALARLEGATPYNEVLEVTLDGEGVANVQRYPHPSPI